MYEFQGVCRGDVCIVWVGIVYCVSLGYAFAQRLADREGVGVHLAGCVLPKLGPPTPLPPAGRPRFCWWASLPASLSHRAIPNHRQLDAKETRELQQRIKESVDQRVQRLLEADKYQKTPYAPGVKGG